MTFRAPTERCIRWSAWEGFETGIEHLDIRRESNGIVVAGIIAGSDEDAGSYALSYGLAIDEAWRVRDAELSLTSGTRRSRLLAHEWAGKARSQGLHRHRHPGVPAHQYPPHPPACS